MKLAQLCDPAWCEIRKRTVDNITDGTFYEVVLFSEDFTVLTLKEAIVRLINGSDFVKQVQRVRMVQQQYFKHRTDQLLAYARQEEQQLDAMLKRMNDFATPKQQELWKR